MSQIMLDVELRERDVIVTLPPCIPLEAVSDLTEYFGCVLAPFNPRQLAHQIKFALPSFPTDRQINRFVQALITHGNCWMACYPKLVEEKRREAVMMGKHLRVVPGPI